jgi:hypothetical protein
MPQTESAIVKKDHPEVLHPIIAGAGTVNAERFLNRLVNVLTNMQMFEGYDRQVLDRELHLAMAVRDSARGNAELSAEQQEKIQVQIYLTALDPTYRHTAGGKALVAATAKEFELV